MKCANDNCVNDLTGRQKKYCSRACGGRQKVNPTGAVCPECGDYFAFTTRAIQTFCGHSCAATFGNRGKDRSVDLMTRIRSRVSVLPDGCWSYDGAHSSGTLPRPHIGSKGQTLHVYRVLWEAEHGPAPTKGEGELHHTCGNHACVNPDHLEVLTVLEHRRRHAEARRSEQPTKELIQC